MARLPKDMILWGWKDGACTEPIRITDEGIRAEQAFRERHGWLTGIYRKGTEPTGLREQVAAIKAQRQD